MKVYISVDIEGISGVVSPEQGTPGNPDYERARTRMTKEANAAVLGARAAGATDVLVNDSHGGMRNLLVEELDTWADVVYGSPKPFSMMEGMDRSFDMAFLVGYHARAGTPSAILDHTFSGRCVAHVELNGRSVGEIGLNAALAGIFGVPVGLVTGDRAATAEATSLLGPNLHTVTVKEAVANQAARCLHPEEVQSLIRQEAEQAMMTNQVEPLVLETPVTMRLMLKSSLMADYASLIPGSRRLDGYTLEYVHDDYLTVYKVLRAMIKLAS
jgi:D-amino peptidase